jgi:hypothetical protein
MRAYNFPASSGLYVLCGIVWFHRGSLQELSREITGGRSAGWGD